jgi:hypothetical protein
LSEAVGWKKGRDPFIQRLVSHLDGRNKCLDIPKILENLRGLCN